MCPCYEPTEFSDNTAAEEGTMLHSAVEMGNISLCEDDDQEFLVTRCIEYQDELVKQYNPEKVVVAHEQHVVIEDLTRGTFDLLIYDDGPKADLLDWKFGRLPVTEAEKNVQVQAYVLGVFLKPELTHIQEVTAHLVCPRQDEVTTAVYLREKKDLLYERINAIILSVMDEEKSERLNEKGCRMCGRKAKCQAMTSTALTVASNLNLPLPVEFEPGKLVRPEDRSKAQVLSYILEDWAKQVRQFNLSAALEDGEEIPGFEIRSRKGNSKVTETANAIAAICENHGLPQERVAQACTLSLPKVVDELYAYYDQKGDKKPKKALRDQVKAELEEYIREGIGITFLQRKKGQTNEAILQENR